MCVRRGSVLDPFMYAMFFNSISETVRAACPSVNLDGRGTGSCHKGFAARVFRHAVGQQPLPGPGSHQ